MKMRFSATCPICGAKNIFESVDDYWSCRDGLKSPSCALGWCVTRERALATVLKQMFPYDLNKRTIYECSPCMRGISLHLKNTCENYVPTGYFPDKPRGCIVGHYRNEDLENLTIPNGSVDIWIHLDVLEHLFHPFQALREIFRTLKDDGVCLFTVPTYPDRARSEQVAFLQHDGNIKTIGQPEYHGNPQDPENGSLVTWRYGYDLPLLIQRETGFDVEVRRWQSTSIAVMGPMTEVYICTKPR